MEVDDVDVIIGGPPYQGFSVSGKRMLDDPRNKLYKSFVEIVREIMPKVFVMENVPGLIRLFFVGINKEKINNKKELIFPIAINGEGLEHVITCKEAISDLDFVPDDISLGEDINYIIEPQNDYQKKMREGSSSIKNHSITILLKEQKNFYRIMINQFF